MHGYCSSYRTVPKLMQCRSTMLSRSAALAFGRATRTPHLHFHWRICAALGQAADGGAPAPPLATKEPELIWPGLAHWRSHVNRLRHWGKAAPEEATVGAGAQPPDQAHQPPPASLAAWGRRVLLTPDPRAKAALTHAAFEACLAGQLEVGSAEPVAAPARPSRPELVPPRRIPSMKASPLPLNIYQLHNLAHVELNAIDLAWDTVVRFAPLCLPRAFYADFARWVAAAVW